MVPASLDGGTYVHSYVITAQPGGASKTVVDGATSVHFDGLENDVAYTFTVVAVNDAGRSEPSLPSESRSPTSEQVDTDEDGLPDILEDRAGSNPSLVDSDFDGLTDAVEVLQLIAYTSATDSDSDDDGTGDAESDADGDGLTNLQETEAGLSPTNPDTDGDGLLDGDELGSGTDPASADSDADGVDDGDELALGLDPQARDSETPTARDLVHDGVTVTASGLPADLLDLQISATTDLPIPGAVTGAVTVSAASAAEGDETATSRQAGGWAAASATLGSLVVAVHAMADATDREFGAFVWDAELHSWRPAPNVVRVVPADRAVVIDNPETGATYTVVDLAVRRASLLQCELAADGEAPLSVQIVLDQTPSVHSADPTGERFNAVNAVLGTLRAGDVPFLQTFGVVETSFGWGSAFLPEYDRLPVVGFRGTDLDRAREQVAYLADEAGWWVPEGDPDTDIGGFADSAYSPSRWPFAPGPRNPYVGNPTPGCRGQATVIVTDGALEPTDESEGSFLTQTSPAVHFLDVGAGGAQADWMRRVAAQTGGSYTHVPTGGDVQLDRPVPADPEPADYVTDSDGDGVSDWVETQGVYASGSSDIGAAEGRVARFFSDPFDADTDGDGLLDGEELGEPLTLAELGGFRPSIDRSITVYHVRSDPGSVDGDDDGLSDAEELDTQNLNALHSDQDGDGLLDGGEAEAGLNPFVADFDHDGFSDAHEVEYAEHGFDPTVYNDVVSETQYIEDFTLGMFCGDNNVCRRDSIAWLSGNIASGLLVYGDVRDFVAAVLEIRVGDAALIAVGAVPGPGDLIGSAAKVVKFIAHVGPSAAMAVPAWKLMKRTVGGDLDVFVDSVAEFFPDLVRHLRDDLSLSTGSIAKLLSSNSPEYLEDLFSRPNARIEFISPGRASQVGEDAAEEIRNGFMRSGRDGEVYLRNSLGVAEDFSSGCRKAGQLDPCRYPDAVTSAGRVETFHESKVGFVRGMFASWQLLKDVALRDTSNGDIEITWHFFASDRTGKVGASQSFLDDLEAFGVPYVIHLPR